MDSDSLGQYSYRRGIVFSTALSVVARGLTFLTAVAIAYRFGTSVATDVYFYCYVLATALVGIVGMLNAMVVVPEIMRLQVQEGQTSAMRFANAVLYGYVAVTLAICAAAASFPLAVAGVGSRFSQAALEANQPTIILFIPLFLVMVVGQYLVDLLACQRYFTVPMLSSAGNNLLALGAILTLGTSAGLKIVPASLITGFVVQIAVLVLLMKRRFGWRFLEVTFPGRGGLVGHVALSQVANVVAVVGASLPSYLMSGLNPGLVTALQYGQRTAELPNSVLTAQFSAVAGIKFNDLAARGDCGQMDVLFLRSARFLFSVLLPVAVLLSVYAPETVSLLYGHGEFTAAAAGQTSGFLRGLALILPLLAVNALVSRLTMARQRIVPWSWFIIGSNVVSSLWAFLVIDRFGPSAYPAGVVVFYIANTGVLFLYMRRQHPEISVGKALGALSHLLPPTGVIAALLLCSKILLSTWPGWSRIAFGVVLYCTAVLAFPSAFLAFPEASEALSHGSWAQRIRRLLAVALG